MFGIRLKEVFNCLTQSKWREVFNLESFTAGKIIPEKCWDQLSDVCVARQEGPR